VSIGVTLAVSGGIGTAGTRVGARAFD